jgi:hypothetical protein
MSLRRWLLLGIALDLLMFFPGVYMAVNAVTLAMTYPESGFVTAVAFFFQAWPIFCLLCPFVAWRIHGRRPEDWNPVIMVAAPLVYAVFLVGFLYAS